MLASGEYSPSLGVHPILGRTLTVEDDRMHLAVAVLSYRFWKQVFSGDPQVVGRTIRTNGVPLTVVGVTPPQFTRAILGVFPLLPGPLPIILQLPPQRH